MCLFSFLWPLPHITVRNLASVLPLDLICSFSYFKFITFWKILKTFHASHAPKKQKGTCLTEPFPPSAVFQNSDSQAYFFVFQYFHFLFFIDAYFQQRSFKTEFVFCFCLTRLKCKIVCYSIVQYTVVHV